MTTTISFLKVLGQQLIQKVSSMNPENQKEKYSRRLEVPHWDKM